MILPELNDAKESGRDRLVVSGQMIAGQVIAAK
jgi:hypothetical protein